MAYYRGDYYRGDYYRGDPFLGGLIAGAAGKLIGKAARWAGGRMGGGIGRAAGAVARDAAPAVVGGAAGWAAGQRFGPIGQIPQLPGLGPLMGGERKKYRRMNPLNPKALRRALKRAEGFEKFARKTVSGLRYGAKKFKSQRRAS